MKHLPAGCALLALVIASCSGGQAAGEACDGNAACDSGALCISGVCRLVCVDDGDCSGTQVCQSGVCLPGTRPRGDARSGGDTARGDVRGGDLVVMGDTRVPGDLRPPGDIVNGDTNRGDTAVGDGRPPGDRNMGDTAVVLPSITSPAAGSIFDDSMVTFLFSSGTATVTLWRIEVGTFLGGADLFETTTPFPDPFVTATGLPTTGGAVFVRLWYFDGATWASVDSQYLALHLGVVATDGFETGTVDGGTGWATNWTLGGSLSWIKNGVMPWARTGQGMMDLRGGTATAERSVDLFGRDGAHLEFYATVISFQVGHTFEVLMSTDGGTNYVQILELDHNDNGGYRLVDIDLSGTPLTSTTRFSFRAHMGNNDHRVYIDDMRVYR